jgi:hypothetical protein
MTMGRGTVSALALALLLGAAGCGDGGVDTGDNTVVVIHVNIDQGVPSVYQIEVNAHLGNGGQNANLRFPLEKTSQPIASGATLALLIPPSVMDQLNLTVYGLDDGSPQTRVASAMAMQTMIGGGGRVDVYVDLKACTTGC